MKKWAKLTHMTSIAISGLTSHMSHSVSVRLCAHLQVDPDSPSCRAPPRFVEPEAPDTLPSCVGTLIVLAVVGSMSLILANCKP